MKIVVLRSPKVLQGVLRMLFGISLAPMLCVLYAAVFVLALHLRRSSRTRDLTDASGGAPKASAATRKCAA